MCLSAARIEGRHMADRIAVANAPVSFGVDEIIVDDAWMPEPDAILDIMVDLGFEGTELGPPGYLGTAEQVRERLSSRNLQLVGSFLPQRFTRDEAAAEDRLWLKESLALVRDGAPEGSNTLAILSDGFDDKGRMAYAGRIDEHPELWLDDAGWRRLIDNLHRSADICRDAAFEPVIHPHAGTYLETRDEWNRLLDSIDASRLGLCLDTGHARFGGADAVELVDNYHSLIRHVHVKDCSTAILDDVKREGKGMEEALVRGAFTELGNGDSNIGDVIGALERHGYEGWLVIEQDRFLFAKDTMETLRESQRRNRDYLHALGI
jgi:inosose dehydratase